MSYKYASGQKAIAICDVCGFQYKLRELKELIVKGNKTNIKACPECWNPDQPQNKLGEFPVEDPQALRNPRPDSAELVASRDIQWGWDPVGLNDPFGLTPDNLEGRGAVGHSNSNYELGDRNENEVKIKREGPEGNRVP
jgi:hypothetical protein